MMCTRIARFSGNFNLIAEISPHSSKIRFQQIILKKIFSEAYERNPPVDILAFGAHPDDVELGCGGTLVKLKKIGYKTAIADLTEGELGSRGTVKQRYQESAEAAELLELEFRTNLKIPDGHIKINEENKNKLIDLIRHTRPRLILAPS